MVELRAYVRDLKHEIVEREGLSEAIRQFVSRFSDATGIAVDLDMTGALSAPNGHADDVYHLVVEGLSNVARHTSGRTASLHIGRDGEALRICIQDAGNNAHPSATFMPHSIAERAATL